VKKDDGSSVGSGDGLKQRGARSLRWLAGMLSLRFTLASGKLSAEEKAHGRSENILVVVWVASTELGREDSREGGCSQELVTW
jgi:hypothetical protein